MVGANYPARNSNRAGQCPARHSTRWHACASSDCDSLRLIPFTFYCWTLSRGDCAVMVAPTASAWFPGGCGFTVVHETATVGLTLGACLRGPGGAGGI